MPLKPAYLALAGAGVIVAVAGVKGWGVGGTFRDVISGKDPSQNASLTAQITGASGYGYGTAAEGIGSLTGAASNNIAATAESLIGFPYKWGAAPATGISDCSGFSNLVIGKLCGRSIPGFPNGSFAGTTHGPNCAAWLLWLASGGIKRIPLASTRAGDLAIWQTHMGIIVDGSQNMVSDLNPALGTRQTSIKDAAPPGELLICARLR
jgi:cell wall-associated NlpC family hydrolase